MTRFRLIFGALVATAMAAGVACTRNQNDAAVEPTGPSDREFTLVAVMTGYYGRGGEIDGTRNPVLRAREGETVSITIVNGERMVHDIALRRHRVRSDTIVESGAVTGITFVAETDDRYYCTIPGHVEAGMAGEFKLIDDTPVVAHNEL